jgi:hypothetical protein
MRRRWRASKRAKLDTCWWATSGGGWGLLDLHRGLAAVVAVAVGASGLIELLPFTGETEELFPCCAVCEPPTATGGAPLDAIVGEEFF